MTLQVAIASENDAFDRSVFEALLTLSLGRTVEAWNTTMQFSGWPSVRRLAAVFVARAAAAGITHIIIAMDNDGGARKHPEHDDTHVSAKHVTDRAGCRTCHLASWLGSSLPSSPLHICLAVPVQTLEAWLLVARGDTLEPTPEQCYHRPTLKKRLFGDLQLPEAQRTAIALACLSAPGAQLRLRARASFRRFEVGLKDW